MKTKRSTGGSIGRGVRTKLITIHTVNSHSAISDFHFTAQDLNSHCDCVELHREELEADSYKFIVSNKGNLFTACIALQAAEPPRENSFLNC